MMTEPKQTTSMADVYSDDVASLETLCDHTSADYSFVITADADPDAFSRVANVLTLANVSPWELTLRRERNNTLLIVVQIGPIRHVIADMIRRKTSKLTCINSVDMAIC